MKKITIVWTIILVIIVIGLTFIGFQFKKENINALMEEELVKQAEKYLGYYVSKYPKQGETLKLKYDELKSEGYDAKLEENCDGYVVVTNENAGFKYKAYVSCPNYKTEGYSEE